MDYHLGDDYPLKREQNLPTMGKLKLLHISDLHIGNFVYSNVSDLAISLVEAMEEHDKKVDYVVVTGDIFDGLSKTKKQDMQDALAFFETLHKELNRNCANNLERTDFFFVPGNHDQIRIKPEEGGDTLQRFREFLNAFYPNNYFEEQYDQEHLFTIKVFEDKKVALIGLNSCMIETQPLLDDRTKQKLDKKARQVLDAVPLSEGVDKEAIKQQIIEKLCAEEKWDDYGEISKSQLRAAFSQLKQALKAPEEYTLVACFHHHFYPFPEIYDKYGDSSLIRNFSNVIDTLLRNKVKVVLHGHKHLPIIRPVTNQKYLTDSNAMLYVFSAGSAGKKDVTNRSFQIVEVHSPDHQKIAEVHRFNYKQETLDKLESFCFPPKRKYEKNDYVLLLEMLQEEFYEESKNYQEIYELDNVAQGFKIDQIIQNISQTITLFDAVKKDLKNSSQYVLTLLLSIHYRINALNLHHSSQKTSQTIIDKLQQALHELIGLPTYEPKLFQLLASSTNKEFEENYGHIEKNASSQEKRLTAYSTIAVFFTDLYLTLSQYGEFYYKQEKLNANIKLEDDTFHSNIPVTTIQISSDVERRSSLVQFKCKNPTVHKIAVLIVKEFEKKINKIEDSFKLLDLKIYYLNAKIEKNNYDLENFNFEAYIPTLLPLLTGDNLYKQKEVFIRELLQNSLDAILLREKVDKANAGEIDKTIRITYGEEQNPKDGKWRKFLKIADQGVGMDEFRIERYFTSVGRSFYVSDEFEELQKNEDIEYRPISNFGIGFLSAFMVSKEIKVETRSYDKDTGLKIEIPNFDGCFFITQEEHYSVGTTITLYEDERKLLDFDKIVIYIKRTILDFSLDIKIEDTINNVSEIWKAHHIRQKNSLTLFLPLTDHGIKEISWKSDIKTRKFIDKYPFGLLIDFPIHPSGQDEPEVFLNSGIRLSSASRRFFRYPYSTKYYNFPSSYLELDVAREQILQFKNKYFEPEKALLILAAQAEELIEDTKENKSELPLVALDNIYRFFAQNDLDQTALLRLKSKLFALSINSGDKDNILVSLRPPEGKNVLNIDFKDMFRLLFKCINMFITELDDKNVKEKFNHRFEIEFNRRFEEFNHRFEIEFNHRFEEFNHRFEIEFNHRFEKFNHRFEKFNPELEEFNHRFEIFNQRFEKSNHRFEKFNYRFEKLNHLFFSLVKELSSKKEKQLILRRSRKTDTSEEVLKNTLYNVLISSMIQDKRRKAFIISNLYLRLYYFYYHLSRELTIEQAKTFKIEF